MTTFAHIHIQSHWELEERALRLQATADEFTRQANHVPMSIGARRLKLEAAARYALRARIASGKLKRARGY